MSSRADRHSLLETASCVAVATNDLCLENASSAANGTLKLCNVTMLTSAPCRFYQCENLATCQNTNGSAICTCPANYVDDGISGAIGGTGCAGALQRTIAGLLVNVSFDATTIQAKASELMAGNLVRVANARFRGGIRLAIR